jgi:hypothetical protein
MDKIGFRKLIRECIEEVLKESLVEGKKNKWIKKAVNPAHKGHCTSMTKKTCIPHKKVLAKSFKKEVDEGRRICAWCKKIMGDAPDVNGDTHGICPDCKKKMLKNYSGKKEPVVKEMTSTGAVQGFYGKNWVDPDPKRTRMKKIAAKSVGGKIA